MSDTNSIAKVGILPKSGPARAGFAVKRSDNRIWTDVDGTQRPVGTDNVIVLTANRTITAKESGTKFVFNSTTSLDVTLPAPAVGLEFVFYVKVAATSGTGHNIKTNGSSEKTYGKVTATGAALSEAAGKGVVNTQATGSKGDAGRVYSDGTDWFFTPHTGTWAVGA